MFRKITITVALLLVILGTTHLYAGASRLEDGDTQIDETILQENTTHSIDVEAEEQPAPPTEESTPKEETFPTISEPIAIGLEIQKEATKTNYFINEKIETSDISVALKYDDDSIVALRQDEFFINNVDMSTVGEKEVEIICKDFKASYVIVVDYNIVPVDSEKRYSTTDLNLRTGPGTDFDIIVTVPYNTELTLMGTLQDSVWVKVLYNEKECFCSSTFLSTEKVIVNNDITITKEDMEKYGTTVKGEAGAKSSVILAANKYWANHVPNWLENKFNNSGWKIIVSATPLNRRFGYSGSIAGITSYNNQTIYLDNREAIMDRTIVHELGHFIDWQNGFVSCSEEFEAIFAEERLAYKDVISAGDGHHISSSTEYFASVFRDIIVLGKDSLGNIPKSYEFVSRYIG